MDRDDDLDWEDLRYFLSAARAGTLAGAARAMGVDHSTIGRRLTAIERALDAPLFVRAPDGLHLTPLGETLVPAVEDIERSVLALQDRASARGARVRLATPTGFAALISAHLPRLRQSFPRLTLELLAGSRPLNLKRGEADLAIRSGPVSDQDLIVRPLGTSGWSLYAAPAYLAAHAAPLDPEDLRGHDLIGYDAALASVPAAQWVEAHLPGATLVLRSRELSDMQAAAVGAAGLALLPCLSADTEPGLVRLTPRVLATRDLWLVYGRESRLSRPVRAVIDFVLDVMRDNAARIGGQRGA